MEKIPDIIGSILWFSAFATPLITIPIFWKQKELKVIYRITFALFIAALVSFALFSIAMAILLRDGFGPT